MCVIYLTSILNKMCINTSHVLALCEMQQLWCKWTNHSGVHSTNKHPWRNEHSLGKDQKQSSQILISTYVHIWISVYQSRSFKRLQNSIFIWWVEFPSLPYAQSLHHFCFTGSPAKLPGSASTSVLEMTDWLKLSPLQPCFPLYESWYLGNFALSSHSLELLPRLHLILYFFIIESCRLLSRWE